MKGNSKNEFIIEKLGGRRNLREHGVSNVTCNTDGSIVLIFEGYRRVTLKAVEDDRYMLVRPSVVESEGIHLNLTMYEMLDIISNSCNISIWLTTDKSKGQLFSESVIENLGGMEFLKRNLGIRDVRYLTGKEQLDFIVKESLGNDTKIRIFNNGTGITIEKKKDLYGYSNTEKIEISDMSLIVEALEKLVGYGKSKKRNVMVRNRVR